MGLQWGYCLLLVLACRESTSAGSVREAKGLFPNSEHVKDLTEEEFESITRGLEPWIIDFYAPWCGHCQHYAPKWEKVGSLLATYEGISVGAVNCVALSNACRQMKVKSYPTLKAFHLPGQPASFEEIGSTLESREPEKIKEFVLQKVGNKVDFLHNPVGPDKSALPPSQSIARREEYSTQKAWAQIINGPFKGGISSPKECSMWRHDMASSVQHLLGHAIFAGRDALTAGEQAALEDWLLLLRELFPEARARAALWDLYEHVEGRQLWSAGTWDGYLEAWQLGDYPDHGKENNPQGWPACRQTLGEGVGYGPLYVCGLWAVLHAATLAEAIPPGVALASIHGYIRQFFECEDCQKHFLQAWDGCRFGRCRLVPGPTGAAAAAGATAGAPLADPAAARREAALWAWRLHNDVNLRVAARKGARGDAALAAVLWPSAQACPGCRVGGPGAAGGKGGVGAAAAAPAGVVWDEDRVYELLRATYGCAPAAGGGGGLGAAALWLGAKGGGPALLGVVFCLWAAVCLVRLHGRSRRQARNPYGFASGGKRGVNGV